MLFRGGPFLLHGRLHGGLVALTPDGDLLSDADALATELKHAVPDCLFLAVARRFDVPLLTADRTFRDRGHRSMRASRASWAAMGTER
jgi:predicted nucleic acid-binding protein